MYLPVIKYQIKPISLLYASSPLTVSVVITPSNTTTMTSVSNLNVLYHPVIILSNTTFVTLSPVAYNAVSASNYAIKYIFVSLLTVAYNAVSASSNTTKIQTLLGRNAVSVCRINTKYNSCWSKTGRLLLYLLVE